VTQRQRDPLIGAVVGERYRLLSKIGSGGMGTVYKVEHVHMGKVMAIKLLHGDLSRDEGMLRRFQREARAISRLTSPHTVQIFDYGQSDGLVFLVMEYLRGRDLAELLHEVGPLSIERALDVARQIGLALREAHDCGVIHRDLKPENIFVCAPRGGRELIKVLDFGLAKFAEREEVGSQTLQGSLLGTPHYMPPEQIHNEETTPRSDIYSLGALLFRALTGEPPYAGRNPVSILSAHLKEPVPVASARLASLHPERGEAIEALKALDAVLIRAMAKSPADRYATASELVEALQQAWERRGEVPAPAQAPWVVPDEGQDAASISTRQDWERYERSLRVRRAAAWGGLVVVAGLVAAGASWAWGKDDLLDRSFEAEPNDRPAQATRLRVGQQIQGALGLPEAGRRSDQDVYDLRHHGPRGDALSIEVSGVPGLDLLLEVCDGAGDCFVRSNGGRVGEGEVLRGVVWTGGPLYLAVREVWIEGMPARSAPESRYTLQVTAAPPPASWEREPNHLPRLARPIHEGEVSEGFVSDVSDRDLYALPPLPPEGAMLRASLLSEPGPEATVELVDGAGRPLGRWPVDARGEVAVFVAPVGRQPLHLAVVSGGEPDTFHAPASPYRLSVELDPLGASRLLSVPASQEP
jgi:serine/threonine-protein kinase